MQWVIADTVPPEHRVALLDRLANDAMREPLVRGLAELVRGDLSERSRAEALLALVHRAVPYKPDPVNVEVFQPVVDTIARGGDCEDLATLYVALARLHGLDARVRWLHQQIHGAALNHVYAVVRLDGAWVDVEASIAGAELGESPPSAARRLRR